jgi:hypothetical protein
MHIYSTRDCRRSGRRIGLSFSPRKGTKMVGRPKASLLKDSFRKRKHTVFSKASQLADRFGAHVYVVVQFNGRYYIYDSGTKQQ